MIENLIMEILKEKIFLGIIIGTLIEYIFPPIPSEIVLPISGYIISINRLGIFGLIYGIFFATIGTTIGALFFYFLSFYLGRKFIEKYGKKFFIDKKKLRAAEKWFKKYGKKAVLIGRMVPGIREIISIPAGLLKMNLVEYVFYTFIGSFIWSSILIIFGYIFGISQLSLVQQISNLIFFIAIISILSFLIFKRLVK